MVYESNGDFMNNEKKLMKFLKENNGYITTRDFLLLGINKTQIPKFIEEKLIRRVSRGIYINNSLIEDEYYILQKRYSNIVFSYNTAFHILNLTNRTPFEIDITTIRSNRIRGDYNVHYVTEEKFNIGIIEIESSFGNPIKIYNAERNICDMLKSDCEIDLELHNRILNKYFYSKDKDLDKLIEYSKIFNIYEKVNTIIEVMMRW